MHIGSLATHGKDVELRGTSMRFGDHTAVCQTDLTIKAGEFFSILGPSGCGKTTLLRLISGFLQPTSGDILIGGETMLGVGPNRRPTALIFQNLALFPMMPVWENVAFGLEARGMPKAQRRKRAEELLDLVALGDQATKTPGQLSGGQRQRVAIARALAVEPSVLLLDEPLSALDLKLRQHMRAELRAIQRKIGITFIYITHDQGEALAMSDRIAVMNRGAIEQVDAADAIYARPRTPFVATFVGEHNVFHGTISQTAEGVCVLDTPLGPLRGQNLDGLSVGDAAMMFVRPERLRLSGPTPSDNTLDATITGRDLEGAFVHLHLDAKGQPLVLHLTNTGEAAPHNGNPATIGFAASDALVMRAGAVSDE